MLSPNVSAILSYLNTCRLQDSQTQRPFVARMEKLAKLLFWAAIAAFLPVVAIAGWAWVDLPVGSTLRMAGLISGLTSQVLMVLALSFPIVAAVAALRYWRTDTLQQLLAGFAAEAVYVARLLEYPLCDLEHVHRLLTQKIGRQERRIASVFGDKVALFTLAVLGFSAIQALGGFTAVSEKFTLGVWNHPLNLGLLLGLAVLTGLA